MKSPAGWALATMWYDKYPGVPPRGSPLEAVFTMVALQRQQADLLATKSLVFSALADGEASGKAALETYQSFFDVMFPFLEAAQSTDEETKRQLLEHVKYPISIDMGEFRKVFAQNAKAKAEGKFGRFKVEK